MSKTVQLRPFIAYSELSMESSYHLETSTLLRRMHNSGRKQLRNRRECGPGGQRGIADLRKSFHVTVLRELASRKRSLWRSIHRYFPAEAGTIEPCSTKFHRENSGRHALLRLAILAIRCILSHDGAIRVVREKPLITTETDRA